MQQGTTRLAAFQYRDFRLLWMGELVSTAGSQMQIFAINWHVFELLRDQTFTLSLLGHQITMSSEAFGLGMLGLVRVIPIFIFALVGGILADTMARRTLMIWTRTAAALFAGALTALTLSGQISVESIFVLTALGTAAVAFDSPARQSIVPNLVRPEHLTNAVSLNTLIYQVASIVGPALAGLLVAHFDIGLVYGINTATFFVAIAALGLIRYRGAVQATNGIGWAALKEGVHFTYRKRIIWGTMLLDFFATLFSSARTMLPIVADDILHVGVRGYGILATAQPVGSLIVGVVMALRSDIKRQGVVLLLSVALYGLATALFGISTSFGLSYVLFALTGAGDTISTVIRGTIRQLHTPDHLRGRMVSVNMIFFMGGPQLGELEAGLVAAAMGAPFAIFTGGIATILLTGWVAWRFPSILHYQGDSEPVPETQAKPSLG
jgi:MFS family permease